MINVMISSRSQIYGGTYVAEFDVFGGLGLSRLYCSSHDFVHLLAPRVPM